MKFHFSRLAPVFAAVALLQGSPIQAQNAASALCENGECRPAIAITKYGGRKAFALTDGRNEAIIVPEIGRVMRFGKIGGPNLLWNLSGPTPPRGGYINFGGDKTWLAPQSSWQQFHGKNGWPPDAAFDGKPHEAEVLSGGKLKLTTPLSPTGIQLSRVMFFDENDDFVIEQTAQKLKGEPVRASIWSITQTAPGQAVFLPINTKSDYDGGFLNMMGSGEAQKSVLVKPNLLRIIPIGTGGGAKFGVDSPVSSLVSVRDGVAFLQKTAKPAGIYPDGKNGDGFPIELYINGDAKAFYFEMEMLGPLKTFAVGGKSTHTVRWSLHDLPSKDANSPAVANAVEKLLFER